LDMLKAPATGAGSEAALGPATHEAPPVVPQPTAGERFGMGAVDQLYGGAQTVAHTAPDWLRDAGMAATNLIHRTLGLSEVEATTPEELDARIRKREADYQTARGPNAGFDWWRLGGNVAGTVPLALMAPQGALGAVGAGAIAGGLQP